MSRADQISPDDRIWAALADPTRRALLDALVAGPKTTGSLCGCFPYVSRFAVMKHLGVLDRAGLLAIRRRGRERFNHLNAAPFAQLKARWISPRAETLGDALAALARLAEEKPMTDLTAPLTAVEIALDWTIAAPPERVWRTLFDGVDTWWPADMRAGPAGAALTFEERIGGELVETGPAGAGLSWYRVIALDPGESVDLAGQLAARYGGPATSLVRLKLEPSGDETVLKLTDSVFGRLGDGFRANATEGWREIFGGLVAVVSRVSQ